MRKKLSISLLVIVVCITFLISTLVDPAQAQSSTLTPTVTPTWIPFQAASPTLISTPTAVVTKFTNPNVVTFSQIQGEERSSDIVMRGPFDSDGLTFALPANWVLKEGAQIDLLFGVSFNSPTDVQGESNVTSIGGGTLNVFLNDILLSTLPLNEVGEVEEKITIPLSAFEAVRRDKINVLWFRLESSESCRFFGQNMTVFIHPTSFLTLLHDDIQPSTSLIDFPRPIFQNSFFPDSVLLIIPDQPSPAELQAVLTTAAGLGKLSSNKLILNLTTVGAFNNALEADNHLIFIGKAASLPVLAGLGLPVPAVNGEFPLSSDGPDDGLVEMIVSPWSNSHVLLVISANTDQGIIKAAQAVSTGVIRPNRQNNFALIQQVNLTPISNPLSVDRTLTNLGYQGRTFENRGYNTEQYTFNVPAGMSVNPDAYFEIVYGHSALMDYNSSQIVLMINGQPIGSVRMNDTTASLPTNQFKIMIPPVAIKPGDNRLEIVVNMVSIDECSPPDVRGLWVNIWPQSTLHLPMVAVSSIPFTPQNLGTYPAPFNYDPALGSTAFVLEHNDLESWRNAMQIAAYLGYQTSGSIIELSAFYGDEMPVTERSNYNLLVIGRPSQMPIVREMNNNLPAPFLDDSDMAGESNFQVTYRIPSDSPMGYIETMQSPWNSNNVVLAILGNTTEGVNWAAKALIDPVLRSRLGGNFAVVNNSQILTTNTLYSVASTGQISVTQPPNVEDAPLGVPSTQTQVPESRPGWVLPTMALSVGLIVLTIVIVIVRHRSLNSVRRNARDVKRIAGRDEEPKV